MPYQPILYRIFLWPCAHVAVLILDGVQNDTIEPTDGLTALHLAAKFAKKPDTFRLLVARGGWSVTARTRAGETVLHLVARKANLAGAIALIATLRERGLYTQVSVPCQKAHSFLLDAVPCPYMC
jgi:ankyrin repeat protein